MLEGRPLLAGGTKSAAKAKTQTTAKCDQKRHQFYQKAKIKTFFSCLRLAIAQAFGGCGGHVEANS